MAQANVDGAQLGACAACWDQYLVADGRVFPNGGRQVIVSLDFVEAVPGWKSEWICGVAAQHHNTGGWMLQLTKEGELHSAEMVAMAVAVWLDKLMQHAACEVQDLWLGIQDGSLLGPSGGLCQWHTGFKQGPV